MLVMLGIERNEPDSADQDAHAASSLDMFDKL